MTTKLPKITVPPMPKREIVVIGGSAGSLDAIKVVLNHFAADLAAAVIVVIHLRARERSFLAQALSLACPLPVLSVADHQRIEKGKVYVAILNHHVIVAKDHFHLSQGPKEGLHRPSINVTFRSAAESYKDGVVGVLLSGMLDDGASGLWEIVKQGGVAIVQDPADAMFPSMPIAALQDTPIQYTLPATRIGPMVNKIVSGQEEPPMSHVSSNYEPSMERFSGFTCPECRGPLYEKNTGLLEFRCRVGHTFSLPSLLEEGTNTQERKMYEAMVALSEGSDMARYAAEHSPEPNKQLSAEADQLRSYSDAIRRMIEDRKVGQDLDVREKSPKLKIEMVGD